LLKKSHFSLIEVKFRRGLVSTASVKKGPFRLGGEEKQLLAQLVEKWSDVLRGSRGIGRRKIYLL